jgi:integrase
VIVPDLGTIRLNDLTPSCISGFLGRLISKIRIDGCPLSPDAVRHIHHILLHMLEDAVKSGYIASNPARKAARTRRENHRLRLPSEQGIVTILTVARNTSAYIPILLAARCGLRQREICDLTWGAVDPTECSVTVKRPINLCRPSLRYVSGSVMTELLKHRQSMETLLGRPIVNTDYVCASDIGQPLTSVALHRLIQKTATRAELTNTNLLALRLAYVANLLEQRKAQGNKESK